MRACVGERMPVSYHDGGDDDGAVLHARSVIWKQRRVLDQDQFVCVVPVADLQGEENMSGAGRQNDNDIQLYCDIK